MSDEEIELGRFLARWRQFTIADRNAILGGLPDSRRRQLLRLLEEAETAEAILDRQFAAYSDWLGRLIENVHRADAHRPEIVGHLKPAVREALQRAHGKVGPDESQSDILSPMMTRLRQMVDGWLQRT